MLISLFFARSSTWSSVTSEAVSSPSESIDDRPAPQLGGLLVPRQVLERDVERVVERGRARGLGRADRLLERAEVVGEGLQRRRALVELHHLREVLRPQRLREADRRVLRGLELLLHRGRGVDHQHQRDRQVLVREQAQVLADAVLEHREVALRQVGHEVVARVGDREAQVDDLDPACRRSGPLLARLGEARGRQGERRREGEREKPRRLHGGARNLASAGARVVLQQELRESAPWCLASRR